MPLTQLTHALEGSSGAPAASADGARIAFRSTQDFSGGNPDGSPELFLFDTPSQTFTQLTYSTAGGSGPPVISADGTRVAFHSTQDLLGANPDGNAELFLFDARAHTLAQLTASTGPFGSGSFSPALSADGTRLAFHSNLDLTGENPDGTFEVFLSEATTLALRQLTRAPQGDSSAPAITADGTRVAFESYQDLTGENADGSAEIFLVDTTTQALAQLTETAATTNALPRITAAGTHILCEAESTIGEAFPLFLADLATGALTPLQHSTEAGRFQAALNASGSRLIFASAQDLTGANADGSQELFVVSAVP